MLLKDFIKASYAEMQIFKDDKILYVYNWADTFKDDKFIKKYGNLTVKKFYAVTQSVVKVIVTE